MRAPTHTPRPPARGLLARLHRSERGAAMAEFVLLVPVMILMWMGIDYFRSGYARRIDALGKSQTEAWGLAYSNDMRCFKQGGSTSFGGIAGLMADLGGGGGEQANKAFDSFSSSTKDSSSMFLYAHGSAKHAEATNKAGWDQSVSGTVAGATLVMCNEVVPDGKHDDNVLEPLKSFVSDVFKF